MQQLTLQQADKRQRTLFSLGKVVRLEASSVCFLPEDITSLRDLLHKPETEKQTLLTALRKLDCYKLQLPDLVSTQIGSAVSTLAASHPKLEVARLAAAVLEKWRAMVEGELFKAVQGYDAEAASAAPEGEDPVVAAEAAIAAAAEAERQERYERRRLKEEGLLDSSSDEEIEDSDDEWQPGGRPKRAAAEPASKPDQPQSLLPPGGKPEKTQSLLRF